MAISDLDKLDDALGLLRDMGVIGGNEVLKRAAECLVDMTQRYDHLETLYFSLKGDVHPGPNGTIVTAHNLIAEMKRLDFIGEIAMTLPRRHEILIAMTGSEPPKNTTQAEFKELEREVFIFNDGDGWHLTTLGEMEAEDNMP